ncbi:MAG: ATP synthase F1 subunit epsilon [Flavobacteriales bacterium]|nr:ATP synthase F1 subunit epsilon [Flavobacteriales bacterium]|tara:strand:- start:24662 stop:24898 length:237 start_codon:yes stop_codon:yes gene_type:complete
MIVEIITPEKELFKGEVNSVKVPGSMGEFEILENHAPIISTLKEGEIRIIKSNNSVEKFQINGGVIEMQKNKVIVLAD